MSLQARLTVTRGNFTLDVDLSVAAGETLALLGPNGSGKSTLLAAVAGLLPPERGLVVVKGRTLTDVRVGAEREVSVPARRRRVGLLGQDPLLFPHLSAVENIAFGQRARGTRMVLARERARRWLDEVGLAGMEERTPAELSGGQQQRVAIARALAAEPDVLLLDEPMAALDVENASLIRTLLRERLTASGLATIVVTHDVVDAMVLADRVAILDAGRIVDVGPVKRVLGQPVNGFAATLVGLNLLDGVVNTDGAVLVADGRRFLGHGVLPAAGTAVRVVFPPSAVVLGSPTAFPSAPNSWSATVALLEPAVRGIRVVLSGDGITAEAAAAGLVSAGIAQGSAVTASVDPALVTVYPSRSELKAPRR